MREKLTFREFIFKVRDEYMPQKPEWLDVWFMDPGDLITPDMCPNDGISICNEYYADSSYPEGYTPNEWCFYVNTFGWHWIMCDFLKDKHFETFLEMKKICKICEKYKDDFTQFETREDVDRRIRNAQLMKNN